MRKHLFETSLSVLLTIYPGVELLDHELILFLVIEDPPFCFLAVLRFTTVYIPANSAPFSSFSTSSATLVILCLFFITALVMGVRSANSNIFEVG